MATVAATCPHCQRLSDVSGHVADWHCSECGKPFRMVQQKAPALNLIYSDKPTLSRTLDKVTRTH